MSEKVRKGWKWASKDQEKHCLQGGWRDGCEVDASEAQKAHFLQIYALLRPKRVFALFPVLSVKRAKIRS